MQVLLSIILLTVITGLFFWGLIALIFSKGEIFEQSIEDYDYDINEHESYWRDTDGRNK